MEKTLNRRSFLKALGGLAGIAGVSGLGGCVATTDMDEGLHYIFGDASKIHQRQEREKREREARIRYYESQSRQQGNQANYHNQQAPEKREPEFFSCNGFSGQYRNAYMQGNEFLNKKNIFNINEPIVLVAKWPDTYQGKSSAVIKRTSDNRQLQSWEFGWVNDGRKKGDYHNFITMSFDKLAQNEIRDIDEYSIEWRFDGNIIGIYNFIVKK